MPDERWLQMTEAAGWDLPGNNRINRSEADNFLASVHELRCWFQQSRGWPTWAGRDGIEGPGRNWSAYLPISLSLAATTSWRAKARHPRLLPIQALQGVDGGLGLVRK